MGISFNWDIHWVCNYRCPYCWFYGKWEYLKGQNLYPAVEQLVRFWKNIYSKYGKAKISITGGEPFLYPNFTELIKELSQLHMIEIVTNLSIDIDNFIKEANLENLEIRPSFHPLFADFDTFVERAIALKVKKPEQNISYLAWPPQIKQLRFLQDKFLKFGISIFTQPFYGEYKGTRYPDSYTDEEKNIIAPFLGNRGGKTFQVEPIKTRGKPCAAGQRYAVIHPDGKVLRCGGLNSLSPDKAIIGNLLDEDFELLREPLPCDSEICPCNEWAFLLKE